jgi:hypothetical protein
MGMDDDAAPDAALEAELRQAADLFDPVPPELIRDAITAFGLRALDAELAELTYDSLLEDGVRGRDAPRMLTFTAGALYISVEISGDRWLIGQLLPPRPARIEVRGRNSTISATADSLGRFASGPLASGPFSLRLRLDPDVVTDWV